MKKIFAMLMAVAAISMVACDGQQKKNANDSDSLQKAQTENVQNGETTANVENND